MNCDLHTHTSHSDGSYTPRELVLAAKERDLIIALTDHNTVSGIPEFMSICEEFGVKGINGTELSTEQDGREFHLIGLFIEPEYFDRVEGLCLDYHELKKKSNIQLIDRLRERGYDIDYFETEGMNVKGRVNRAHIAAQLLSKGYVGSIREAFDSLLDEKCGLYIPPKRISLADAIAFLREIKCVSVLAHPLKELTAERLREIIPELKAAGLVAMETMHSSYSEEQIAVSKQIAAEFGLLESGGSDFHGKMKPGIELGVGRGNLSIDESYYLGLLNAKNGM